MIGEIKIARASKQCQIGQRPLRPGEVYFSVLVPLGEDFRRIETAAEHWKGPPGDAVGWWRNRMPLAEDKKRELAPPEVLLELLRSMEHQSTKTQGRYLLALLLLRKRHLRSAVMPQGTPKQSSLLHLESVLDGSAFQIEIVEISDTDAAGLQSEIMELIYRDADSDE